MTHSFIHSLIYTWLYKYLLCVGHSAGYGGNGGKTEDVGTLHHSLVLRSFPSAFFFFVLFCFELICSFPQLSALNKWVEAQIPILCEAHTLGETSHMPQLAHAPFFFFQERICYVFNRDLKNRCSFYSTTQWKYFYSLLGKINISHWHQVWAYRDARWNTVFGAYLLKNLLLIWN